MASIEPFHKHVIRRLNMKISGGTLFFRNFLKVFFIIFTCTSSVWAINKCCPENQIFNKDYYCVNVQSARNVSKLDEEWGNWSTEQNFQVTSTTLPCFRNYSDIVHFNEAKLLRSRKLLLKNDSVLSEKNYCFEFYPDPSSESKLLRIVYFCPCVDLLCIWKCCLQRQKLYLTDKSESPVFKCINDTDNHEWNISKMNISKVPEYHITKFKLRQCEHPKSFSLKLGGKDKYSLQKNGSIISYDYEDEIEKFDYCGDMEITDSGTYEPVVIACVQPTPIKKKIFIDGILNSIGSFFLFLTVVLHIWLPELHSLPGKCLTCHASCLLVALICISINQLFITLPSPTDIGCCILGNFFV